MITGRVSKWIDEKGDIGARMEWVDWHSAQVVIPAASYKLHIVCRPALMDP